jgi:Dolichyl-phosphate-mannose-protein mannosyltransferase
MPPGRAKLGFIGLLILLSLPDLFSPPISPTIARQTQTYSQTRHFVASGFSPAGMAMDIDGPRLFRVVYEFPLYQTVVGSLFALYRPGFFWGKLVSLSAAVAGLWIFLQLARDQWGDPVAWRAGLFLATSPITLLLSTAFQPDALALALAAGALYVLNRWRQAPTLSRWLVFLLLLLASALAKVPILVPFLPLVAVSVLRVGGRWRRPTAVEILLALVVFFVPFAAWSLYRTTLMDSSSLVVERSMFFVGDLSRFLQSSFYLKLALILGAMAMCGAGVPLAVLGLRDLDAAGRALILGAVLYFVLIPTAAEQTYYALPLAPLLALLMARGMLWLEQRLSAKVQPAVVACWTAGFLVAAPYTLRHDTVSLEAARAASAVSATDDLLFVMNMHDRGVGVGGLNPSIVTLADRRGWNVQFDTTDVDVLRRQIEARRTDGARWIVATWFTPDLDPWFMPLLPASFSRCPRLNGEPIDGRAITDRLSRHYPVVATGPNFALLRLPSDSNEALARPRNESIDAPDDGDRDVKHLQLHARESPPLEHAAVEPPGRH